MVKSYYELTIVVVSSSLLFLVNFATLRAFSHLLSPADFGAYSLIMAVLAFGTIVLVSPFSQYIGRYGKMLERNDFDYLNLIFSILWLVVSIILAFFLHSQVAREYLPTSGNILALAGLMIGMIYFSGRTSISIAFAHAKRLRLTGGGLALSEGIARLLLSILAIVMLSATISSVLIGYLIASSISALFGLLLLDRSLKRSFDGKTAVQSIDVLNYSGPLVLGGVMSSAIIYTDRWLVLAYLDLKSVAHYSAATSLAFAVIGGIYTIANQYYLPIIFSKAASQILSDIDDAFLMLKNYIRLFIFASIILWCLTCVASGFVYKIMFPAEYMEFHLLMPLATFGYCIYFCGDLLLVFGQIAGKTAIYWWAKIPSIVILFVSSSYLVKMFGVYGVSISFAAASIVYVAIVLKINISLKHER